jgi:tyrosinase
MPDVVELPTLSILTGSGDQTVPNPFYQYKFQTFPLNPAYFPSNPNIAGDAWLANYTTTVRGSTRNGGPSNPSLVNTNLASGQLMKNTARNLFRRASRAMLLTSYI